LAAFVGAIAFIRLERASEGDDQHWDFLRLTRFLLVSTGFYAAIVLGLVFAAPFVRNDATDGNGGGIRTTVIIFLLVSALWLLGLIIDRWSTFIRRRGFIAKVQEQQLRAVTLRGPAISIDAWASDSGEAGRILVTKSCAAELATLHDGRRLKDRSLISVRLKWHRYCERVQLIDESAGLLSTERRVWMSGGAREGLIELPERVWRGSLKLRLDTQEAARQPTRV
jgi:F0F1-type ATP synthase membrane subunit c/vacuolar-type H+-ATPase subunit K